MFFFTEVFYLQHRLVATWLAPHTQYPTSVADVVSRCMVGGAHRTFAETEQSQTDVPETGLWIQTDVPFSDGGIFSQTDVPYRRRNVRTDVLRDGGSRRMSPRRT